jgi:hypothetical protein
MNTSGEWNRSVALTLVRVVGSVQDTERGKMDCFEQKAKHIFPLLGNSLTETLPIIWAVHGKHDNPNQVV